MEAELKYLVALITLATLILGLAGYGHGLRRLRHRRG